MDMIIRPARFDDEDQIVGLWAACGLVVAHNDPRADFRFARAKPSSDVLVGLDEGGLIAASGMVGHDGHRGWLYYLATRPDRRGQGLGRAVVDATERWFAERGVVKMQLLVRETNTGVVAFYERLGFETAPRVVMQKWIIDPAP